VNGAKIRRLTIDLNKLDINRIFCTDLGEDYLVDDYMDEFWAEFWAELWTELFNRRANK